MLLMPVAVSYFTGGALCLTAAFQAGGSVLSYSKSSTTSPTAALVSRSTARPAASNPGFIVRETGLIEHQIPTYYRFSPSCTHSVMNETQDHLVELRKVDSTQRRDPSGNTYDLHRRLYDEDCNRPPAEKTERERKRPHAKHGASSLSMRNTMFSASLTSWRFWK